jgi:hypothetical protein
VDRRYRLLKREWHRGPLPSYQGHVHPRCVGQPPSPPHSGTLTLETKPPCPGGFVVSGSSYSRGVRPATAIAIIVLLVLIVIAGIFQALAIMRAS